MGYSVITDTIFALLVLGFFAYVGYNVQKSTNELRRDMELLDKK